MVVPSVIFLVGCLLVALPVRRSPDQGAVSTAPLIPSASPLPGDDRADAEVRPAGRPLDEVTDPFALEVHRPVQPEDPQPELSVLPTYAPREHDAELGQVVRASVAGGSGIAVLVGGSSTGKTRACWEALQLLRDQPEPWRLWHPIDPSRPEAALRELPGIGPQTVVWLNEAQFYLDAADGGLGERVAAGLRELLRDPARGPVLVLATLWPQFWDGLTARPAAGADPHAQARELLAGHDISVPSAFSPVQLRRLSQAGDARLAKAAAAAQGGQVIQFLAGAPELLARYRNAPPAAKALIHAAMDARRLGMGPALPQAFLAAAAPGYLTDTEWDTLGDDWLEHALAYTAVPCKGVRGPLTRIRRHPDRSRAPEPGSRDSGEQLASGPADISGIALYRLADYLDQYGRQHRKDQFPPEGFWAAAAGHAFPSDQAALGDAAEHRGLYRDAAQLYKNAVACGDFRAVHYFSYPPHHFRADVRPVCWAAAHAPLDDPYDVAALLNALRKAGAEQQAAALLRRDPAAHAPLDDPYDVAALLDALREAGAHEQAAALLRRDPAAHAPLDDPYDVAALLDALREAGAHEQAAALLRRDPAAHACLDSPFDVARLLGSLREAGAHEQAAALADRAAAHVPLDNLRGLGRLLGSLREAGAHEQAAALADRIPLDNPYAVAWLLDSQREAGAEQQAAAVLRRDPAGHAPLDDPRGVAWLLDSLRQAGAEQQAAALLRRDPAAHVCLDGPYAVTWLLDSLREAGAHEQAAAVLRRDPAGHAPLDDPRGVAWLLGWLREAGAEQQAAAVLRRDPAGHAPLDDPRGVAWLLGWLREAGAEQQAAAVLRRDPAGHTPLDDPRSVAWLLDSLRQAGAEQQAAALLRRDPAAHVCLDDPYAVTWLLDSLREAGAHEQAAALADRAAAHARLDGLRGPSDLAWLLDSLREAGAEQQAAALLRRDPAAHVCLDDPYAVARLLDSLREAGAEQQAAALVDRLPGAGRFELFREQESRQDRFWFGREADGRPAGFWGWEDLD